MAPSVSLIAFSIALIQLGTAISCILLDAAKLRLAADIVSASLTTRQAQASGTHWSAFSDTCVIGLPANLSLNLQSPCRISLSSGIGSNGAFVETAKFTAMLCYAAFSRGLVLLVGGSVFVVCCFQPDVCSAGWWVLCVCCTRAYSARARVMMRDMLTVTLR